MATNVENVFFPNPALLNPSRQTGNSGQNLPNADGTSSAFGQILDQKLPLTDGIKFSQHAQDRLRLRGITMNAAQIGQLNSAVNDVAKKGGKDSLIMMGDSAFVVSVKNRTVVTALDRNQMQGNVFTNIDSAVVI